MVKHIRPLRLDDEFICTALLKEARVKIVLDFEIKLISNGEVCAKGRSEQVAFLIPEMEMVFKIPEEVQKALYGSDQLK
jgi:acyl-CoA thioester hydrolase